jgi:hypothetical protein
MALYAVTLQRKRWYTTTGQHSVTSQHTVLLCKQVVYIGLYKVIYVLKECATYYKSALHIYIYIIYIYLFIYFNCKWVFLPGGSDLQ